MHRPFAPYYTATVIFKLIFSVFAAAFFGNGVITALAEGIAP